MVMGQAGGAAGDVIMSIIMPHFNRNYAREKPMPNSPADPLLTAFWSRKIPLPAGPRNCI
jgi:hypothetical protein